MSEFSLATIKIMITKNINYRIDCDNEGHWYLIPETNYNDFNDWLDSEDYKLGREPGYVIQINGPECVVFQNPLVD